MKVAKILEKMLVKSCKDMRENAGEKLSRYKRKCWRKVVKILRYTTDEKLSR